jgi:uncharacterized protein (TIGR02147 family)
MNYLREFQSFVLSRELRRRQKKNKSVSLRSMALSLSISPSILSRVINKERSLSIPMAIKVADALKLSKKDKDQFINEKLKPLNSKQIQDDAVSYEVLAEWEHYAIYELLKKGIPSHRNQLLERFELSPTRLTTVLVNLEKVGMVEVKGDLVHKLDDAVVTTEDVKSQALLDSHKENCDLAKEKLEAISVLERDFSCIVLPIDPAKIVLAKELIRKFRKDFIAMMHAEESVDVYQCNIQLFPLTKSNH